MVAGTELLAGTKICMPCAVLSLDTTNVYAEIDLQTKAEALAKCEITGDAPGGKRWKQADVMAFLRTIRGPTYVALGPTKIPLQQRLRRPIEAIAKAAVYENDRRRAITVAVNADSAAVNFLDDH